MGSWRVLGCGGILTALALAGLCLAFFATTGALSVEPFQQATTPADRPLAAATPLPVEVTRTPGDEVIILSKEGVLAAVAERRAQTGSLVLTVIGAQKTTRGDRALVSIFLRLANQGPQPVRFDPQALSLHDRRGGRHRPSGQGTAPAGPTNLGAGQTQDLALLFEVPREATGLTLWYEPGGQPAITIPLPSGF